MAIQAVFCIIFAVLLNTAHSTPLLPPVAPSGVDLPITSIIGDELSSTPLPLPIAGAGGSPKPIAINGKRGFAYNDPSLSAYFSKPGQVSKISWAYNWASDPYFPSGQYAANSFNRAMSYTPMLWGTNTDMTSIWDANVAAAMANFTADSLLAFNEPDTCCAGCGGTCMDVPSAVAAYRQWIQPYAGTLKLGSPAVTNGVGNDIGVGWLQQFMDSCTGCQVDFIAVHWYGDVNNPQSLKDYISSCWKKFNVPIWLTEFGVNNGNEQQIAGFLKEVMPWLDRQAYVERYAYFMARNTGSPYLLNGDYSMTAIGSTFMSA